MWDLETIKWMNKLPYKVGHSVSFRLGRDWYNGTITKLNGNGEILEAVVEGWGTFQFDGDGPDEISYKENDK